MCHEGAAEILPVSGPALKAEAAGEDDPRWAEVAATDVVVPEQTFSSALVLDLGDRPVELVHPGRGHTAGDLVLRVPDADVVLAGDLVEESEQRGTVVPGFGDDCYPMEWPLTLDVVLGLTTARSVVVPGHGASSTATSSRSSATRSASSARRSATWPPAAYPSTTRLPQPSGPTHATHWRNAVRRGYEHLPRSQKRLPLV